jgi:hypothetical protein
MNFMGLDHIVHECAMANFELIIQISLLKSDEDLLAPGGSEIRLLTTMQEGGLCHSILLVGTTSFGATMVMLAVFAASVSPVDLAAVGLELISDTVIPYAKWLFD